jgi:hypothetical protein
MAPIHASRIKENPGRTYWTARKCSKHHPISTKQELKQTIFVKKDDM